MAPFTSDQLVITRRPGFDWDARICLSPGVHVFVHDAYGAGEGILHAALSGLITLVDLRGTPEMAEGELMRFLAEAAWYPRHCCPAKVSAGTRWTTGRRGRRWWTAPPRSPLSFASMPKG